MAGTLKAIPSQRRSQRERNQLRQHRDWLRAHVEPLVRDLLRCEGFWATARPRWSQSRTQSSAHLQIGGLCYWPAARDPGQKRHDAHDMHERGGHHLGHGVAARLHLDPRAPEPARSYASQGTRVPRAHQADLAIARPAQRVTRGVPCRALDSHPEHPARERAHRRQPPSHQATKDAYHAQWQHAQRTFRDRHS
jgi:hypothetical protein